MRDRIARLAAWLRALIFPAPGRHSGTYLCHTTVPTSPAPILRPEPALAVVDDVAGTWDSGGFGPLIRSHVLAHEEEQRRQRIEEEKALRAHRRAALAVAVQGSWDRLDAEAEGWAVPRQSPAVSGVPEPAGWDYPEALYVDPGTDLFTVRVQRRADGSAVLA